MDAAQQEATARARELQRSWYGEPLGALFRRLIDDLGLNQARLAAVLGLSAPMLSQLMSGQRAKIGNPAVVQRVQALQELAVQVADGSVSAAEATDRMEEVKKSQGGSVLTGSGQTGAGTGTGSGAPTVRRVVREIQSLLRSVAAAGDIIDAADSLAPAHPELAEFLRVYGAGRTAEAVAHYESHQN
ncbi:MULTISPECIES: DNA-binding protein [unclassified Streptomyces]|uniref:helix-turn-helix domain-containing protein n=1 Tax=unclassified Streptomyces TaxID=2593676 RepID=UPI003450D43D